MNPIPPELEAQRGIEDRAIALGTERQKLEDEMARNTWAIIELLRDPAHTRVPLDFLASLLTVSRQSLYRWRDIAQKIPEGMTVAEWNATAGPGRHRKARSHN